MSVLLLIGNWRQQYGTSPSGEKEGEGTRVQKVGMGWTIVGVRRSEHRKRGQGVGKTTKYADKKTRRERSRKTGRYGSQVENT
jgi:hypothetical protein